MTPTNWSAPIPMLIIALGVTLASEIAVGFVAISENNLTLLGVAAIGAFGALAGTLISAHTAIRLARHEAQYKQDQRRSHLVVVKGKDATLIGDEEIEALADDDQERKR